jgi:hypothetical protein
MQTIIIFRSCYFYLIPASKSYQDHFWAWAVFLTPASKVTKPPFRCGRAMSISLRRRRATQTNFGAVGLSLFLIPLSKVHPDQFWAGRVVSISFRRQRSHRPLWGGQAVSISHSGVEGHPDHFWAHRAVSFSFGV